MTKMFGVPMQDIMVALLVVTGLCLASVAFIAWRQRTIFKMALRNLPRRKAQTVLIVFGLMLATTIISSALTIDDTLAYSIKKQVYDGAGPVDLLVVKGQERNGRVAALEGPAGYFDRATHDALRDKVAGAADIDGVAPVLLGQVAVLDETSRQSEPAASLTGVDAADAAALGGITARDGGAIDLAALRDGEIVINAALADRLGAGPGDRIVLFGPGGERAFTLARVARNGGLAGLGALTGGGDITGAVLLPAAAAQALAGPDAAGRYNAILVSARGDAAGGLAHEAAARDAVRAAVADTGLAVDPIKRRNLDEAELIGNVFTSFFLIFGLFAIASGVMLIFLIFVMLAAERRAEMGMARAVGAKRRHLIQGFVAEGAAYDLLAAGVGAALGVGVAFAITGTMARLLGSEEIAIAPRVEPRSLVIAYCLGVVVTFLTIAVSAWRVSRLNIVAAIRDLDDVAAPGGSWRGLLLGLLGVGLGVALAATAGDRLAPFSFGVSLAILAAAPILQRLRLPDRLIASLTGGALVVFWGLPAAQFERLFGKREGDIEMLFVSGLMMVAGVVLLLIGNSGAILALVGRVAGVARRLGPAVRMGTAYPLASRFRTGLTLYMFALIMFVLVTMTAINANFDRLYNDPARTTGGWDVTGQTLPGSPVGDLRGTLAAGGVNVGDIAAIGGVSSVPPDQARLQTAGGARPAAGHPLNGVDDKWLAATGYHLRARADGYADDAAVWRAVRENPDNVVLDLTAVPNADAGADPDRWQVEGIAADATTFGPVRVELRSPATGQARTVTVVGVTDTFVADTRGIYANQRLIDEVFGPRPATTYFFKLAPGADDRATARAIEAATLRHGMQAGSIHEAIAEDNRISAGFFALLQGFIGLGLVVRIAALGVVAFRAVVERRQQIGMLRAIGFSRGLVAAGFLVESLFITGLGIFAGVTMAILLSYNFFTGGEFGDTGGAAFFVPWGQVALFSGIALAAALLMTALPARQAGAVAPAEALRYE